MKKKIAALLLLLVMICGAVFTSCNNSAELIEKDEVRRALTITLYCITDEETTPEAIQKVEDAINQITKKRYSTQIKLRFYKESEYNGVIDNLVSDIALEEKKREDDESLNEISKRESKRIDAIDKLIAKDKEDVTTKQLIVWSKETEAEDTDEEAETFETTQNIFGDSVEKYPDATDTQVDIFLICGVQNLNKYVTEEPYATDDESFLVSMDESLTLNSKAIKQYVNETVLLAGKVGNVQYAIPTNKRMADDATYLVLDRELMKKYNYSEDDIRTLTSTAFASYLADIKENESDVIPLKSVPDAPGVVSLFGEESIFGTYVANTAVTGFKAIPKNLLSAYQYTDHIIYMEQYKRNGYIKETSDKNARFGAEVVKMSEDEAAKYDKDKYIVKVLGKPMATSDTVGQYMFGISKYTRDVNRCMEIITLITTNAEIRNLLQYGVEGINYKLLDDGRIQRLNHDYMMNIFATGNTFIAYPEEYMEPDVWEKAKIANGKDEKGMNNTIVSPYLGFLFEKEGNADLIESMKALSADVLKKVKEFDVEKTRLEKLEELKKEYDKYSKLAEEYQKSIDEIKDQAEAFIALINEANEKLVPYSEALDTAKEAIKPYDKKISEKNSLIKDLDKKIADEKKVKPTEEKPDLAPNQENIDKWTKEKEEAELEIRALRGYSYELRKVLSQAQAAYDAQNAIVKDLEKKYEDTKIIGLDPSGKEIEVSLKKAYEGRQSNLESNALDKLKEVQAKIDELTVPEQSELDVKAAELNELIETTQAEFDRVSEESKKLNSETKAITEQLKAAEEDLRKAKLEFAKSETEYFEKYKDAAIALSYVEDKETEISKKQEEITKKETEIAQNKDDTANKQAEIAEKQEAITAKQDEISAKEAEIAENTDEAKKETLNKDLEQLNKDLTQLNKDLEKLNKDLESLVKKPDDLNKKLDDLNKDLDKLNGELGELKEDYDKKCAAVSADIEKYNSAKAALQAKQDAREEIANSEKLTQLAEVEARFKELNVTLKNAMSESDTFKGKAYQVYDEIAMKLYNDFFSNTVKDLEENNAEYQEFMNIGEEQAENENGIVYMYNEWYSSMYGE